MPGSNASDRFWESDPIVAPNARKADLSQLSDEELRQAIAAAMPQSAQPANWWEADKAVPGPDFSGGTLSIGPVDTGIPLPPGMNAWLAGAGKFFADKYRGAKQMSAGMSNALSHLPGMGDAPFLINDQQMAAINREAAQTQSPADKALMQNPNARAGYMTSGVATLGAVPVATAPAAAALAGANAALDPAASSTDRLVNMGQSAALGGATQGALNAVASRFVPAAADTFNTAVTRARQLGLNVFPGQVTGSPTLQLLERGLSMFPGSAGVMQQAAEANTQTANRIIANSIGQDANRITPEVLNQAATDLGQAFDRYKANPAPVRFSQDFFDAVRGIGDAESALPKSEQNPEVFELVKSWAPDFAGAPGAAPTATMQDVMAARSRLAGNAADAFKSGNSSLGRARETVLDALDNEVQNSLSPDFAASYAQTRNQWRNLLAVQKAADPSGGGDISLTRLSTVLRQQNPQAWARTPWGQDDLLDLSRIGHELRDALGNSGTAQREQALNIIGAVTGGAAVGHEAGGVPGMIAGAASPVGAWGLAHLYRSTPGAAAARFAFPGQTVGEVTSPLVRMLLGGSGQIAGMLPSFGRAIGVAPSATAQLLLQSQ